jgi:hypothetical protein
MSKEPKLLWIFCFFGAFGLLSLLSVLGRPSVAKVRAVPVGLHLNGFEG